MLLVSLNQRLVPGLLDHVQKLWAFTVGNRVTSCFGVLCFDKSFRGWADGRVAMSLWPCGASVALNSVAKANSLIALMII